VSLYSGCSRLFGAVFSELALGADVIVLDHVDFVKGYIPLWRNIKQTAIISSPSSARLSGASKLIADIMTGVARSQIWNFWFNLI
jgi:hypothetical protein